MKGADRSGARCSPSSSASATSRPASAQVKDMVSGEQNAVPLSRSHRRGRPPSEGEPLVIRTHDAGSLRAGNAGETVTLTGWVARRRDHGGVVFVDLRDASGFVQVVFREGDAAVAAHELRNEFCIKVVGDVARRPEGSDNPNLATGEVEVVAAALEVLSVSRRAAVPDRGWRRDHQQRRGAAALEVPLPRPAAYGSGPCPAHPGEDHLDHAPGHGGARVPRHRDALPHPVDARGRARLPRPRTPSARFLVRAAAVAPAVQAAADGVGARALLPDRALLPRRGLPRRPHAGVHPARRRDELPRRGGRLRPHRGAARRAVVRGARTSRSRVRSSG